MTSVAHDSSPHKPQAQSTVEDLTATNIALIAELERAAQAKRTFTDRVVDQITGFCGRMAFVWVHIAWFAIWIVLNTTAILGRNPATHAPRHFDPFPFNFLTLSVSLEAIFLSTFILISQNRQGRLAERRSHLDLQINLLSEQENTKMLSMLTSIHEHLGIGAPEPEVVAMQAATEPQRVVEQIEAEMEAGEAGESAGAK